MEPPADRSPIDLGALERRLVARACWYEDPSAYREGVRAALDAVRGQAERDARLARSALAG